MSGTLELLCGPSGVGKVSTLDTIVHSFRMTTREMRPGEVDSRDYDNTCSTDGFFLSEKDFLQYAEENKVVGIHRYPDPETGALYGFPIEMMLDAINKGARLSEQIVDYDALEEVNEAFQEHGIDPLKIMFVSTFNETKKRIYARGGSRDEAEKRIKYSEDNLRKILLNRHKFKGKAITPPEMIIGEERDEILHDYIDRLKRGELPDELFDTLSPFFHTIINVADTRDDIIRIALKEYEGMLPANTPLIRDYVVGDSSTLEAGKCLCHLLTNSHAEDKSYLIPFFVSQNFGEIGENEESSKEMGLFIKAIHDISSDEMGTGYHYIGLMKRFEEAYVHAEKYATELSRGNQDLNLEQKTWTSAYSLYMNIKSANHYWDITNIIGKDSFDESVEDMFNSIIVSSVFEIAYAAAAEIAPGQNGQRIQELKNSAEVTIKELARMRDAGIEDSEDSRGKMLQMTRYMGLSSLHNQTELRMHIYNTFGHTVNAAYEDEEAIRNAAETLILPTYEAAQVAKKYPQHLVHIARTEYESFLNQMINIEHVAKNQEWPLAPFHPIICEPDQFLKRYWNWSYLSMQDPNEGIEKGIQILLPNGVPEEYKK